MCCRFYLLPYVLIIMLQVQLQLLSWSVETSVERQKRFVPVLLFPPTAPTRVQWIVGIGIPLEDLLYEAMTTGYVFKAEYFLPETAKQLRTKTRNPFTAREMLRKDKKTNATKFEQFLSNNDELRWQAKLVHYLEENKKVLSSYRWTVYKALESLAARIAPSGRACILKSICEAAETPFHYRNGMFGELLHILLSPSSSADELSEHADNEYFHAESLGRSGANCGRVFKDCGKSLLEQFSDVYTFKELMLRKLGGVK